MQNYICHIIREGSGDQLTCGKRNRELGERKLVLMDYIEPRNEPQL